MCVHIQGLATLRGSERRGTEHGLVAHKQKPPSHISLTLKRPSSVQNFLERSLRSTGQQSKEEKLARGSSSPHICPSRLSATSQKGLCVFACYGEFAAVCTALWQCCHLSVPSILVI